MTADETVALAARSLNAGDSAEAERACRRALDGEPNHPQALHLLGLICHQLNRFREGLAFLQLSVVADPRRAEFHSNLAAVLGSIGDLPGALESIEKAISLLPERSESHLNRGVTLQRMGRLAEARAAYERAIGLPGGERSVKLLTNYAGILKAMEVFEAAEARYRQAISFDERYARAWHGLGSLLRAEARHDEASDAMVRAARLCPGSPAMYSDLLYNMHYDPRQSRESLFEAHRRWAEMYATGDRHAAPFSNEHSADRRLRIGYLSPYFRQHAVAAFFEPLLGMHDRTNFECHLYSSTHFVDDVSNRLRSMASGWHDVSRLDDVHSADLIREHSIDILVDLAGHSGDNRLGILALKAAPIQVSYMAYPDTTGMTSVDHRLTDSYLDPVGQTERFFTEKLVRLPSIVACYRPDDRAPNVGRLPAESNGFITFGCLNNPAKLNTGVFRLWAQILKRVVGAKLLLRYDGRPTLLERVLNDAGVEPWRVECISKRATTEDYFDTFNRIDIALDPFPYNGHTTSCDGFWMGVPLVTLTGNSYVSRMGVSLLKNIGLADLIAVSGQDYVRIAVELAHDLIGLARIREGLRGRCLTSPLGDAASLARDVEAAYRLMWTRWCE